MLLPAAASDMVATQVSRKSSRGAQHERQHLRGRSRSPRRTRAGTHDRAEPGVAAEPDDDTQGHVYKQPTDPKQADAQGSPFPRATEEQAEA